uniref:Uncharacterized protein n=1 Tax=Plectus sambesii TaxID=2011161 RepID=A0A914VU65_9BILA
MIHRHPPTPRRLKEEIRNVKSVELADLLHTRRSTATVALTTPSPNAGAQAPPSSSALTNVVCISVIGERDGGDKYSGAIDDDKALALSRAQSWKECIVVK